MIAREGLCTAKLGGLKWRHRRRDDRDHQWLSRICDRNSERVRWSLRKTPSMQEVRVWEVCFWTPRISRQMRRPSTTTPTPRGLTVVLIASAISLAILSCTLGLRGHAWTQQPSLPAPATL